ncbi:uncharacterized protein LOC105262366 [Musca domestica]|uniref:Uncharacterized protein LOC105262366 n=1 Tax=Musca domestica TaxID=7370 RepID=A0A1I8NKP9_MUSDO|nr:uncharacterized protein LOC105262366 [Musca domestica]XP_019895087.1 uncharacterized protein LOC105262366 [Musca domestica]XP_019895088.1 uncharacterized protein LOC105262366 [Musca domestica]XP_058980511.1 uncharacterized protein LOC105262366 [Musca domestica]
MATEYQLSPKQRGNQEQQQKKQQQKTTLKSKSHHHQGQEKQWPEGKSITTKSGGGGGGADGHVTNGKTKLLKKQTPVVVSAEGNDDEVVVARPLSRTQQNCGVAEEAVFYDDIFDGPPPDYRIYQEGQVNEFFEATKTTATQDIAPKTVSEICLVNDHYILVKMPTQREVGGEIIREGSKGCQGSNTTMADHKNKGISMNYWRKRPQRLRKIAPIRGGESSDHLDVIVEEEDKGRADSKSSKSLHCLNVNSCWGSKTDDIEIYESKTTIRKTPALAQGIIMVKSEEEREKSAEKSTQTPLKDQNNRVPDIATISGSKIMSSSVHNQILLHNSGSLIADNGDPKQWTLQNCRKNTTPRRGNRFLWLLLPFRSKYRRTKKAKPKIQAVVYKTYFVKWTKPPESLNHGFGGAQSSKLSELGASVLRRCRSAIF